MFTRTLTNGALVLTLKTLIRTFKQQYPLADMNPVIKFLQQHCTETVGEETYDLKAMMKKAQQCMRNNTVLIHLGARILVPKPTPSICAHVTLTGFKFTGVTHSNNVTDMLMVDMTDCTPHTLHFGILRHILKVMALHKERSAGKHACINCCQGMLEANAKTDTLLAQVMKVRSPEFVSLTAPLLQSTIAPEYAASRISGIYLDLISQAFGEPSNHSECAERLNIAEGVVMGTLFTTEQLIKRRTDTAPERGCTTTENIDAEQTDQEPASSATHASEPAKKEFIH